MFKVYKASAGSGKTTSLVAEYLSLCLLEPKKFRHVLAVTFTNNATAEMKDRIVKTLKIFAFRPASEWKGSEAAIYQLIRRDGRYQSLGESEFRDKSLKTGIQFQKLTCINTTEEQLAVIRQGVQKPGLSYLITHTLYFL